MKVFGPACVAVCAAALGYAIPVSAGPLPHLIPQPSRVEYRSCTGGATGTSRSRLPLTAGTSFDPAALDELRERWSALGAGTPHTVRDAVAAIVARRDASLAPQAYRLTVSLGRATIESSDADGAFYGAMTLAQLPARVDGRWSVPCVRIEDRPALRWRVLSDDVSRGPLPTMRYFEERIRTIAAFKMNGYSPYMESVFVSPTDPLPAPLDGITPDQLRTLAQYAARFHVALIPEQQTFAHMHGTLRLERYAGDAELPHGFLLSPAVPGGNEYAVRLIEQELSAVGRPPFFHVGSDETATLGAGRSRDLVMQRALAPVYAAHIAAMNRAIAPSGARLMLWDDAIEKDPSVMPLLPRTATIVNWHYGVEASYRPYIDRVASGGFEQMVAPGSSNWNQLYPAIGTAIANERRFIADGRDARVLGTFQTVWHDDGETLYEATWYPVLYAAAASWQHDDVDPRSFRRDFPAAFFGIDDPAYGDDVDTLGSLYDALKTPSNDNTDALFWAWPFTNTATSGVDLAALRLRAEAVETHLIDAHPPLHSNAAFVMFLAARRYDTLARGFQIAAEVRSMYADAVAHQADTSGPSLRDLYWCRYWMWELRDAYEDIEPLYARAWRYESREGHLASNLERYRIAAARAIRAADAIYRVTYDDFEARKPLPSLDSVLP